MTELMLKPAYDTITDAQALKGKRAKQPYYYDRQARDLPPIAVGETVRLRLPGKKRWTSGICTGTEAHEVTQFEWDVPCIGGTDAI